MIDLLQQRCGDGAVDTDSLLRTSGKGAGAGKLSETGEGTGGEAAAAVCERLQ